MVQFLCVALSTAKAEYIALSAAVQESWLKQLLYELTGTAQSSNISCTDSIPSLILLLHKR